MCKGVRTRKIQVKMDIFHSKKEIRTTECLWTIFILSIVSVHASEMHIDFDDVETSWLKNVAVHAFPVANAHSSILQITGLATTDIEDGIEIKPTYSANDCFGNETELPISSFNSSVIVSLKDFHFKQHSEAYLCIKTKYDQNFQHMGLKSKFSKIWINQFNRDRRNPSVVATTVRSDNKCRTGEIRIDGMRVVAADKTVEYDEDNIPELISRTKTRIRLFGCGFTDQTVITFTKQINDRNGACLLPSSEQFRVSDEGLLEYTAVVDIIVPNAESSPYYFCVKNAEDSVEEKKIDRALPFIHQGTEKWLSLKAGELVVPVWAAIIIICCCLCFSALFSGLNLGLMSLDRTELKILRNTGDLRERNYAAKIQPVRDHGNFLLCSILLGNVLVNSTFTILLDSLTSGLIAVISSTLLIVVFGEITPQAICSRHGLAVGAKTILITKAIMVLTFPLAYPVSKILDIILGEEIGNVYNRERLKELVRVTNDINDLDKDEVNIISGALELRKKTVAGVMTHLEDAFMLSIDAILDFETVSEIMKSGFSRIPVYDGEKHNVQKLLFIKDLALIDPDDNTPLRTLCEFYQNPCFHVFEDETLDKMFKRFKGGQQGHMAFVQRVNNEGDSDPYYETVGLITLEDVIEEMIQAEIVDETDVYTDNRSKKKRKILSRKHDFTMFAAERRDIQRIHISPQLTLATFQYLSTTIDAFKDLSETILRRLLSQDIFHHIKLKSKEKSPQSIMIYEQGKPADYFVLILEGRVEVTVGQEQLLFECGPFTYFGKQALVQSVGVAESPQQAKGSLQSLNLDAVMHQTFVPDYSVRANTDVFYVAIKRTLYLAAKRATLMERSKRFGSEMSSNEPIDYEVEKLLHSLDEDDRSVSVHTNNLNALSPRASKSASPTTTNVERASNGPTSLTEQQESLGVTFVPDKQQSTQVTTPEKESRETDALLSTQN